jgi:hypothetical protein
MTGPFVVATATTITFKGVITRFGIINGKDYKPNELNAGEIGIRMSIDRDANEDPTPEQQLVARDLSLQMCADLLTGSLGVSLEAEEGFKPGMFVCAEGELKGESKSYFGFLVKSTDSGMIIRTYTDVINDKSVLRYIPFASWVVREVPIPLPGRNGAIVVLAEEGLLSPQFPADIRTFTDQSLLKAIAESEKIFPPSRCEAILLLTDIETLERFADVRNSLPIPIRKAACDRLEQLKK